MNLDNYIVIDGVGKRKLKVKFLLQPIVCPRNIKCHYLEILTRFSDENINTEFFFENITPRVSKKIIEHQVNEVNRIECPDGIIFALNLNAKTLSDTKFILSILKILDKRIAFELTSEPLGEEKEAIYKSIFYIKKFGHEIWLDDLLSPGISESMLRFTNWDLVKIDKDIIYTCVNDSMALFNLISKASKFGERRVVLEGVESSTHHVNLLRFKCFHQGYYYGPLIDSFSLVSIGENF
ncbi:EAL domain-containing protein [Vibrio mimicus]|uniref:EAL domain-containing protein n=1 Tax=Vibrio mimicus TaxID=674 RepID=UPI002F92CE82